MMHNICLMTVIILAFLSTCEALCVRSLKPRAFIAGAIHDGDGLGNAIGAGRTIKTTSNNYQKTNPQLPGLPHQTLNKKPLPENYKNLRIEIPPNPGFDTSSSSLPSSRDSFYTAPSSLDSPHSFHTAPNSPSNSFNPTRHEIEPSSSSLASGEHVQSPTRPSSSSSSLASGEHVQNPTKLSTLQRLKTHFITQFKLLQSQYAKFERFRISVKIWLQSLAKRTKRLLMKFIPKNRKPPNGRIKVPTKLPNKDQTEKFVNARDRLIEGFHEKYITEGEISPETISAVANDLNHDIQLRLAPAGDPSKPEYQTSLQTFSQLHLDYLTDLFNRHVTNEKLHPIISEFWNLKRSAIRAKTEQEKQVKVDVEKFLTEFNAQPFQLPNHQYREQKNIEREKTIQDIISNINWEINEEKIKSYFIPLDQFFRTSEFDPSYFRARAARLEREAALVNPPPIPPPRDLTAEKLIEYLPRGIELKDELYYYKMIKLFEKTLQLVQDKAAERLSLRIQDFYAEKFPRIGPLNAAYTKLLTSEEDYAWREGLFGRFSRLDLSPAEVWEKLQQVPEEAEVIGHILDQHADKSLVITDEEIQALRRTSFSKTVFLDQIEELKKQGQDLEREATLATIEKDVQKHISAKRSVNAPFIEELYQIGRIDSSTRDNLMLAQEISDQKFKEILGTKEEFTKKLMDKFSTDLLNILKDNDNKDWKTIERETFRIMTEPYLQFFKEKAKAQYLKPETFTDKNSQGFIEALKVYDSQTIEARADLLHDIDALVKADVEGHLPPQKTAFDSSLDRFLSSIKIPQVKDNSRTIPNDMKIFNLLPGFDPRLETIYKSNLKVGDARLKGTEFENLDITMIEKINEVVNKIYSNRIELDKLAHLKNSLDQKINKNEQLLAPEFPLLSDIFYRFVGKLTGETNLDRIAPAPNRARIAPAPNRANRINRTNRTNRINRTNRTNRANRTNRTNRVNRVNQASN